MGLTSIPWFSVVVVRVEPITPVELYSQMPCHELHRTGQADGDIGSYSSMNTVVRGRGGSGHSPAHGRGHGRGGGRFSSSSSNNRSSTPRALYASTRRPRC
jgi:hypothetical protein